jgi:hypothetical protein
MAHLYEITGEMQTAIQKYNECETDEQLLELEQTLNNIQMSFNEKATACALYTINIDSDVDAIDKEIARLSAKKKTLTGHVEWMKKYLQASMEATRTDKIESPTINLKIQNNPPSVVVDNEGEIPETYKRTKTIIEIDKVAIKKAWETGIGVAGTHIEQKRSLRIK